MWKFCSRNFLFYISDMLFHFLSTSEISRMTRDNFCGKHVSSTKFFVLGHWALQNKSDNYFPSRAWFYLDKFAQLCAIMWGLVVNQGAQPNLIFRLVKVCLCTTCAFFRYLNLIPRLLLNFEPKGSRLQMAIGNFTGFVSFGHWNLKITAGIKTLLIGLYSFLHLTYLSLAEELSEVTWEEFLQAFSF